MNPSSTTARTGFAFQPEYGKSISQTELTEIDPLLVAQCRESSRMVFEHNLVISYYHSGDLWMAHIVAGRLIWRNELRMLLRVRVMLVFLCTVPLPEAVELAAETIRLMDVWLRHELEMEGIVFPNDLYELALRVREDKEEALEKFFGRKPTRKLTDIAEEVMADGDIMEIDDKQQSSVIDRSGVVGQTKDAMIPHGEEEDKAKQIEGVTKRSTVKQRSGVKKKENQHVKHEDEDSAEELLAGAKHAEEPSPSAQAKSRGWKAINKKK